MNETTDATAIFAPLWKRKWLILAVGIIVAAGTYVYYKHKPSVYSVSTQLYLGGSAEEQGLLSEGASSGAKNTASADASNEAALINSPLVGEAVHRKLRKEHQPGAQAAAHGKVRAKAAEKTAFITISAEAHSARGAVLLANATAQAYIRRQYVQHQRAVVAAIAITRKQLQRIEAGARSSASSKGKHSSSSSGSATVQIAALGTKIDRLESQLSAAAVQQIGAAKPSQAQLVSPKPRQNAIFGFVIGIVLAGFAAYALSRFDRRLSSLTDIEGVFETEILTALPAVRHPIVRRDGRLTPSEPLIEPLRRLHTTFQLGDMLVDDRGGRPRSMLFISADAGDGKSTLIANLALVQADSGARVAVIEADFRRPVLGVLLDVDTRHGLADVLTGRLTVGGAMHEVETVRVGVSPDSGSAAGELETAAELATAVGSVGEGSVSVLASGEAVSNPPAVLASRAMTDVLHTVADDFDYVLIDAPSPLQVSDVMPLLHAVDGIVIVARVGHTRHESAQRLAQLLARTSSAPVLGAVANHASGADIQRYGFSSASAEKRRRLKLFNR